MFGRIKRFWYRARDAMTGRFTTRKYAKKHPDVTVEEKVERKEQ